MAAKKSSAQLRRRKKPVGKKAASARRPKNHPKCTLKDICAHLTALNKWLYENIANEDTAGYPNTPYQQLRIAMCNVEAKAFDGAGTTAKRFPACGSGTGGDPAKPPAPPKWG